jgi:Response regulator containing a CheY-like receiver domain and an HTH DNA-binding domain
MIDLEKTRTIQVVLVDDHPVFRNGLKKALERSSRIRVTGEAEDGKTALTVIRQKLPDVLVTDIRLLGDMDGLQLLRAVKASLPDTRVIVLSAFSEENLLLSAVAGGTDGYLLKNADANDVRQAIEAVMKGGAVVSPQLTRIVFNLAARCLDTDNSAIYDTHGLTMRENQVMALLKKGYTDRLIASELNISEKTVHNHTTNIFRKLNINSRRQL